LRLKLSPSKINPPESPIHKSRLFSFIKIRGNKTDIPVSNKPKRKTLAVFNHAVRPPSTAGFGTGKFGRKIEMLDQLVESKSNQKENRYGFLLTTFVLVIGLFFSAVLWSLFAKDLGMGTGFSGIINARRASSSDGRRHAA
jgi:hypothetical protein